MTDAPLLVSTAEGLYCPSGDFHIDPLTPVPRAVITHGHADHARPGCRHYLAARPSGPILKHRLGRDISLMMLDYGETLHLSGLKLSLHPAGHILGSAQVRIESAGQVWVVSGDYKIGADPTCAAFTPLACHTFVTESTFGLPVFNWPSQKAVLVDINAWWLENQKMGKTCIMFAYALGKAQRILAGLDPAIGPIFTHGAVEKINQCYRRRRIALPATRYVGDVEDEAAFKGAMVVAPPSADGNTWTRRFNKPARAFASGWMHIRGHRRRRVVDRGFVISDHCDWQGLNQTIVDTGAETVWVTHGYATELVRWLQEQGLDARTVPTHVSDDTTDD